MPLSQSLPPPPPLTVYDKPLEGKVVSFHIKDKSLIYTLKAVLSWRSRKHYPVEGDLSQKPYLHSPSCIFLFLK